MVRKLSGILGFVALVSLCAASAGAEPFRVGLLLDRGGKDDKSFNSAAFMGATEAKQKLGIQLKEIEASDDSVFEPALRSFINKKYDLVIAIGVNMSEAVKKVAKDNPTAHIAVVDAPVDAPNVKSLMFQEHEGSYLVGAIAAMKSKTGTIGFIGGMDIPLIRRFQMAYEQGAKSVNPKITVITNYTGVTSEAWNNPTKGKELAITQYGRGADIIFTAAGNTNNGVFDAAEKAGKFAIGCDSNQNWIKPGLMLTSMVKRVDLAVYKAIEEASKGKFTPGITRHGLKDQGIDWAHDQYNEKLFTKEDLSKIDALKKRIISGNINVRDYYTSR